MVEKFQPVIECARSLLPSRMKGTTIMWWITVNVLAMCWYALFYDKPLDGSIAVIYSAALAAFVGKKITDVVTERRIKPRLPDDVEDPQGGYK